MTSPDDIQTRKLAELLALTIRLDPLLYQEVVAIATHDRHSGAISSDFIEENLSADLSRASLFDYAVSVVLLTLEPKASINANLLTMLEQRAQKEVVNTLHQFLRSTDWVAKYNLNRQLLIVLPGCPTRHLSVVFEKIETALFGLTFEIPEEKAVPIHVRLVGVVVPPGGADAARVLTVLDETSMGAQQEDREEPVIVELGEA
jgi:GGDEF domain-containing protein